MQPMQPDPTASAFAVRGLTKVYGDKAVVDHLNLDVPRVVSTALSDPTVQVKLPCWEWQQD